MSVPLPATPGPRAVPEISPSSAADASARPSSAVAAAGRRRVKRIGRQGIALLVAVVVAAAFLTYTYGSVLPTAASSATAGENEFTSLSNSVCNAHKSLAPSSLYVSQPEPTQNLSAGGTITGHLAFRVLNYVPSDNAIQLYFPSTFFTFPMVTGGNFSYSVGLQWVPITGPGWLTPAALTKSEVAPNGINFVPNGYSRLSTQKLSIMANATYGTIEVEFKWHWSIEQPNSSKIDSHIWSVPSNFTGTHGTLPSVFFPAPYVSYLGGTGATAYAGQTFTAELGANVAGRYFFLEMEYGGGHVVQDQGFSAPAGATTFNVSIPFLNYDHYLVPGLLLIHIHDSCGALLYNKVVKVTFPPYANITFYTVPATCGTITFNGTAYTNGENGTYTPSLTPYTLTHQACAGYKFSGWHTTGGISIQGSHSILVTSNGTFTVDYA